ncbi:MAG: class I SAM-dependent methyltransferase [Chloroflexi bacterium]|nr:class I SAM-dependent methyltransferase [Chloroflexota bacterium]
MLDHFGLLAPFYEKLIKPKIPEQLLRLAEFPSSGSLLDVGGGTGRVAQYFLGMAIDIIVTDISVEMLEQAKSKHGLNVVGSQSEMLPFQSNHFDRIIMVDALHHVYDQSSTARDLWRVLKPGGRLIIEEPDLAKELVKLIAFAEKLALMRSHFLAPQEIANLFSQFGATTQIERDGVIAWVVIDKQLK